MILLDLHALLHGPGTWTNLALALPVWGSDGSMLEAGNDKTGKPRIPAEISDQSSFGILKPYSFLFCQNRGPAPLFHAAENQHRLLVFFSVGYTIFFFTCSVFGCVFWNVKRTLIGRERALRGSTLARETDGDERGRLFSPLITLLAKGA
ncbi:hypothetical protein KOW79_005727 [Hemibagrus wyckioides]|uniref:Uncharacterized protein n=1 Tax=Hemibagrus wyckioides TaxID=337641 RepID=A0A9D3SUG3_9TELE|nr:hypothetical protein KOW79_005727 [Hemibagrus wyckioides]